MKTLADFKRYLATPEASLKMIYIAYHGVERPVFADGWRTVAKLQTNSVALRTPTAASGRSWIDFGKASDWDFDDALHIATCESGGTKIIYNWL